MKIARTKSEKKLGLNWKYLNTIEECERVRCVFLLLFIVFTLNDISSQYTKPLEIELMVLSMRAHACIYVICQCLGACIRSIC